MRLYDEIFKNTDGMRIARYTVVVDGGGYFEGVKAVGDFSSEKIVLFCGADAIEVEGKRLAIKKYCDGDLQLVGTIQSVRLAPQKEGK